ncbi:MULTISPECIES: SSI family serine proteinase inhibitor [Amycolatopsis]|uniref:Subtilisin inhibitor-like n=2 Tax=Amycolatopsis TaxID=1813 RepID=A0A1I3XNR5_9PSEU|nr:SSI family serine proteinase inhibitor [Amycolatopsis sacchari]SFK20711.1 Subtilisin inhibitor-like [Amycolatopsis sacchari]
MPLPTVVPALVSVLALAHPAPAQSALTLSVRDEAGRGSSVTLECGPTGGTHPHHDRACRTLDSVDGDFGKLPKEQILCTTIYAPVTVAATGHWHGRPVAYSREFPNRCNANAQTADVFNFS